MFVKLIKDLIEVNGFIELALNSTLTPENL